ncbi:hypothetical protein B0H13DRAFT_2676344 [Mycena leptocephala]|nr:hypothetical protein B0H13DRAFT_2676344 [Mycena leptocephala]
MNPVHPPCLFPALLYLPLTLPVHSTCVLARALPNASLFHTVGPRNRPPLRPKTGKSTHLTLLFDDEQQQLALRERFAMPSPMVTAYDLKPAISSSPSPPTSSSPSPPTSPASPRRVSHQLPTSPTPTRPSAQNAPLASSPTPADVRDTDHIAHPATSKLRRSGTRFLGLRKDQERVRERQQIREPSAAEVLTLHESQQTSPTSRVYTVFQTGLNIPRGDTTYTECRAAHLGEGALLRTRKGGFDAPLPLVIRESSGKEELICGSGWNADGRGCELELASLALNVMSLALRITVFPPFKISVETTSWIQASTWLSRSKGLREELRVFAAVPWIVVPRLPHPHAPSESAFLLTMNSCLRF